MLECAPLAHPEQGFNGIYHLHFEKSDIKRDPVVEFILDRVEKKDS